MGMIHFCVSNQLNNLSYI